MQPSPRQQELERLYNSRKGHVPHISISDESHHVTEAIGSYYGDSLSPVGVSGKDPRPLSYMHSASEAYESDITRRPVPASPTSPTRNASVTTSTSDRLQVATDEDFMATRTPKSVKRMGSVGAENIGGQINGQPSPPPLTRQLSGDTAVQQFPLNDIDYESSPAAVAQELSNLQAIRRMSMNVDMADPDLPTFGGFGGVPAVAPSHNEDEDDTSRLFWVPARLHPELAPKEFKTFVEDRVEKIRRRSGGEDSLSPDGLERSASGTSLGRKKSMLSHQIDTKGNYEDGADRLERKRSQGMQLEGRAAVSNLADLETLVSDPQQLIGRMSLDNTRRRSEDSGGEPSMDEDMPILPPVGSLKRSTRTTYRRGSLKEGKRVPFSKRAQQRQQQTGSETEPDSPLQATVNVEADQQEQQPIMGLTRVRTEPIPEPRGDDSKQGSISRKLPSLARGRSSDNLASQRQGETAPSWSNDTLQDEDRPHPEQVAQHPPRTSSQQTQPSASQQNQASVQSQPPTANPAPRQFQSRLASGPGRTTAQLPGYVNTNPLPHPLPHVVETLPDGSKQFSQTSQDRRNHDVRPAPRGGAHMRPVPGRQSTPSQTLDDISSNPSPMPGSGSTRTDALTMIPTYNESKKSEKKEGSRKSSWKWILGNDDDDKKSKNDKAKDNDSSSKANRGGKNGADKVRLDVLQNSIDGGAISRGRESLVLNRDEIRIDEGKKPLDPPRKEKEGLLQTIFGKKKSAEPDGKDKKRKPDRGLSPEPPPRILKPDIDYNWTRFSILEERAIYRMAHIKLANPRRALYSQVLLSNFMYSYLAKVQMMHPQMQIPASQQQKAAQQAAQQAKQKEEQPAEYSQYQRWQEQQTRNDSQASESQQGNGGEQVLRRASYEVATGEFDDDQDLGYGDDHQQRMSTQSNPARVNGERGYSVSSTKDYLGGHKSLWDDDDKGEELW